MKITSSFSSAYQKQDPRERLPSNSEVQKFRPIDSFETKSLKEGLREELGGLGAGQNLKALFKEQGKVKERKQERLLNAAFELALEPSSSPEVVSSVFEEIERGLSDPKVQVVNSTELGGGMNETALVKLSNGLTAVWKPALNFERRSRRNILPCKEEERQRAAYLVDKRLGHLAKVPPSVIREIDGQRGTLSFFLGNATTSDKRMPIALRYLFESQETDDNPIALLDNVIGNVDRHRQNWMISRTEKVVPIDHDMTFPERNGHQGWANYNFHRPLELDIEDREKLEAFSAQREEISAELEPLVGERAVKAMFRRVDGLLSGGKSGSSWLGKTRFKQMHASVLGYVTSENHSLSELPGLNSEQIEALHGAGIKDSQALLAKFGQPDARSHMKDNQEEELASAFTSGELLDALNKADLMRVSGVEPRYADLLQEAGVDTIPELARRNPANLTHTLRGLGTEAPDEGSVAEWIRQAGLMRRRLHY